MSKSWESLPTIFGLPPWDRLQQLRKTVIGADPSFNHGYRDDYLVGQRRLHDKLFAEMTVLFDLGQSVLYHDPNNRCKHTLRAT
jgi:hypothetical protein